MFLLILFVAGVWLVPTLHLEDCDEALVSSVQCDEGACPSDLGARDEHPSNETDEHPEHCPICRVKGIFLEVASLAMLPCQDLPVVQGAFLASGSLEVDPPIHYFLARGPPVRA